MPRKLFFYSSTSILLLINLSILDGCKAPIKNDIKIPYDLSSPDKTYTLQHKISEVSGLSFISDSVVVLIQDEDGVLFYFNLSKETITNTKSFAKDGDYEDLNIIGDTAYILKSDGTLLELINLNGPASDIKKSKYKTSLNKTNDTEGICYDDRRNLLLIVCKGSPGKNKKYKNKKAIYSFDPVTNTLSAEPFLLLDNQQVASKAFGSKINIIEKFILFYKNKNQASFQPSGIAIQPFTRELYLISSSANLLVIIDTMGQLKNVIRLSPSIYKQPEGISFDSKGNLFISNEGKKGKGNILKFSILNN